jgi:hypothetical protein
MSMCCGFRLRERASTASVTSPSSIRTPAKQLNYPPAVRKTHIHKTSVTGPAPSATAAAAAHKGPLDFWAFACLPAHTHTHTHARTRTVIGAFLEGVAPDLLALYLPTLLRSPPAAYTRTLLARVNWEIMAQLDVSPGRVAAPQA